jgi:hypothetical protein
MMGYFSNGTEGMVYEETYCANCVHYGPEGISCAVLELHSIHNYDECNNRDSFLHVLIPRGKDGQNQKCRMLTLDPAKAKS